MSIQSCNEIAYLEYFSPSSHVAGDDPQSKTYYIQVKTPASGGNVKLETLPDLAGMDNQTPTTASDLSTTPVRKIHPSRTYLEDSLALSSSSFTLTPDKEAADLFSPDRSLKQQSLSSNNQGEWLKYGGGPDSGKRGRPRADVINSLIMEGSQSGSNIKCKICSRVFPREKSLQAHLRTHTGERPYNCDYPACTRAFTQSGQLKTHQRLHAGEKPFVCSHPGCNNRYTHANRQCPEHPYAKPQRTSEIILQPNISASEDKAAVYAWLEKYKREKDERTPGKFNTGDAAATPETAGGCYAELKHSRSKRGLTEEMNNCLDQENVPANFSQATPPFHCEGISSITTTPTTSLRIHNAESGNTLNHRRSAAKQTLNDALQRAADNQAVQLRLTASTTQETIANTTTRLMLSERPYTAGASPLKREHVDQQSPTKGIRRTLGDITPTKNCRALADSYHHTDLDLPFNFGLPTSPAAATLTNFVPSSTVNVTSSTAELMLMATRPITHTPRPAEKYIGGGGVTMSPSVEGSPALKLKKRFQERFQEENPVEKEVLAKPILWHEEDVFSTPVKQRQRWPSLSGDSTTNANPPLSSPPSEDYRDPRQRQSSGHRSSSPMARETSSPRLLVAAALVELQDTSREDIPLNLTKYK